MSRATAGRYRIECVKGYRRAELSEFVARVYYERFEFDISYAELYAYLAAEDALYDRYSIIHTVYDADGSIVGTNSLIRAAGEVELPVEKIFGLDLAETAEANAPVHDVWELTRVAVKQNHTTIWVLMLREAVAAMHQDDLVVAGQDEEVFRKLKRIGFPLKTVGAPKHYLGSLTYPVALSLRDLPKSFHPPGSR